MIAGIESARLYYRRYYTLLCVAVGRRIGLEDAEPAIRYAAGCLFRKAVLGAPTKYGPHHYMQAMTITFLHQHSMVISDAECDLIVQEWPEMDNDELLELGVLMSWSNHMMQAAEITSLGRLTLEDALGVWDPVANRWTDGYLHTAENGLVAGVLRRAESALDDPDAPNPDWVKAASTYVTGELDRHKGWAQVPKDQEVKDYGEQPTKVRDRRIPDPEGSDDQVEGQREDRDAVHSTGARTGAHAPDHDGD